MSCQEKEFYIPYPEGKNTRVYMNCTQAGPEFVVFLPGEEGNIVIYSNIDGLGNEIWYEGEAIASQRATEIGKMMEIS